jgi:starvation-inducible DNA-binding protein
MPFVEWAEAKEGLMREDNSEPVKTGLPDDIRRHFAEMLSGVLDDTYSLLVQTHLYHWNVRGPLFADLHKLMEEQYVALFESVDEVAERIRQLGFRAPLSTKTFPSSVRVSDPMPTEEKMVADLVERHEGVARNLRALSAESDERHDYVTQDLANEMLAFHEKAAWMLRSIITTWPQGGGARKA